MPRKKKTEAVVKNEPIVSAPSEDLSFMSGSEDFFEDIETLVRKKRGRRKDRPVNLTSMSEMQRKMLPIRDFPLQQVIGSYGIPHHSILSLVGPEGIGKTTMIFYLMGCAIRAGGLCYYQETEGKAINRSRALRALSTNPEVAKEMMKRIMIEEVHSLRISVEYMCDWVQAVRVEKGLSIDKPIVVAVDTWSKLMSDQEAVGFYNAGPHLGKAALAKAKGIKEGSNLAHASFASDWCRRLAGWLPENNVILILGEHQNTKIDMGGTPSYIPQSYMDKRNKTKIGGNAFNQNAALQWIITRSGEAKYPDKTRSGNRVNLRVDKNSYGPSGREVDFEHRDEHRRDTDTYLEEAFIFDQSLANLLVNQNLFNIRASNERYTSEDLGIIDASADELSRAFYSDPKYAQQAGELLKLDGYYDYYENSKNSENEQISDIEAAK